MKITSLDKYRFISLSSVLIGSISLILFFHFVLLGPFKIIDLKFSNSGTIIFNITLSILFFTQHSLMIRESIRGKIEEYLPHESFYAFHSICTGLLLSATVLLWQKTDWLVFSIRGTYKYIFYFISILSIAGLAWAVRSLTDFDIFGRKQISNFIKKRKAKEQIFILRGPYRFTRHPFYFFILLMIWSHPVITLDRLLFSTIWTLWVTFGTVLEERDLVKEIGQEYVEYQKTVPMLIPYKIFKDQG